MVTVKSKAHSQCYYYAHFHLIREVYMHFYAFKIHEPERDSENNEICRIPIRSSSNDIHHSMSKWQFQYFLRKQTRLCRFFTE